MTIIFCGRFGGYIPKYKHVNIDQTFNSIFVCCSLQSMKRKMSVEGEKLGFRFFDTAPLYSRGYSEMLIGEAFNLKNIRCAIKNLKHGNV